MSMVQTQPNVKPLLRGWSHQIAAMVSVVTGLLLVREASSLRVTAATAVYAFCVTTLFTVSAVYHRPTWKPLTRRWLGQVDHAAIFLLIAGTYTAVSVSALPCGSAHRLLAMTWSAAAAGIVLSFTWWRAPKWLMALIFVAMGWMVTPYIGELIPAMGWTNFGLLLAGGVAYTLGALAYAFRWPNPVPRVFGYHEVFHALVILACGLQFAAVLRMVKLAVDRCG